MKIVSFLKHLFIPHEANDYKPHFFRELTVAIILVLSVFLLGISIGSSLFLRQTVLGVSVTTSVLVDMANETRLAYNEAPLVRNPLLDKAAKLKGEDMSSRGYFSHDSPDGVTPWYWFKQVGYTFLFAGENLAVNFTESTDVQSAWLNSPKHKDNLINANFKEIGIATVEGIYKNNPTIFVVQMFGTQAKAVESPSTTTQPVSLSSEKNPQTNLERVAPEQKDTPQKIAPISDTSPLVKGDTLVTSKIASSSPKQPVQSVQKISETNEFITVKNTENVQENVSMTTPVVEKYSPWYGKFLFNSPAHINTLYKILIEIVLLALLGMILIEIKRQHYKHIAYGVLVLSVLSILIFINQAFIN